MISILCLISVVPLKAHVFNPALPYQIVSVLLLLVTLVFFVFFYRKWQEHRRKVLFKAQTKVRFRNDLIFNYAPSGYWTIQGNVIEFLENSLTLDKFMECIPEGDQRVLFQKFVGKRSEALGKKFRIQLCTNGSGNYTWWEFSCLRRENSLLQGMMMNCEQQKKEEEQLLNAKLAKDSVDIKETVLANMNHDIKSPLSAVVGYSELLSHTDLDISEKDQQEYARIIRTNASMLMKLLDDAVTTNTEDMGVFKFHKTAVNLEELFQDTFETNNILVPSNLKFKLQKGTENLVVEMDKARIKQVLNNFLSNAIKFTELGSITLGWELWDDTDEVELFVEDTGKGISQIDKAKIFDRFFTTDLEHKGLGLGLNICRAIVEQHDGRITVKSKLGKGSRFSAFLPLENKEKKGGNA